MANEYDGMSDEQIVHAILGTERELIGARFMHAQSRLENTSGLRVLRRNIARMQTEIRVREVAANLGKNALVAKYRGSFDAAAASDSTTADGGFLAGVVDKMSTEE